MNFKSRKFHGILINASRANQPKTILIIHMAINWLDIYREIECLIVYVTQREQKNK